MLFQRFLRELRGKFPWSWFDQNRTIWKDNGWDALHAAVHTNNVFSRAFVLLNIDKFIGYAMRIKPASRHTTITAPLCAYILITSCFSEGGNRVSCTNSSFD